MKSRKTNWTNNNAPVGKQNCRTKTNKSIGSTVFNELKTFHRFSCLRMHELCSFNNMNISCYIILLNKYVNEFNMRMK